ncbi:hypothetical protein Catovirus_1_836 [Catovirus CTV1]|uniref:Uncharacterized protein n=1 Tax=Catovirus CTV1 TaxID=1977631 RepID=A0A1V0SAQ8_9VIRU|nr:hypothetical protein Catovirus_1_836 [Catovirus CTV1]
MNDYSLFQNLYKKFYNFFSDNKSELLQVIIEPSYNISFSDKEVEHIKTCIKNNMSFTYENTVIRIKMKIGFSMKIYRYDDYYLVVYNSSNKHYEYNCNSMSELYDHINLLNTINNMINKN